MLKFRLLTTLPFLLGSILLIGSVGVFWQEYQAYESFSAFRAREHFPYEGLYMILFLFSLAVTLAGALLLYASFTGITYRDNRYHVHTSYWSGRILKKWVFERSENVDFCTLFWITAIVTGTLTWLLLMAIGFLLVLIFEPWEFLKMLAIFIGFIVVLVGCVLAPFAFVVWRERRREAAKAEWGTRIPEIQSPQIESHASAFAPKPVTNFFKRFARLVGNGLIACFIGIGHVVTQVLAYKNKHRELCPMVELHD